jgi:hypothetical protein
MRKDEVDDLVRRQVICRIAFRGGRHPYMAPFQYVTIGDSLYFHFANYGKKMKMLGRDHHVCVEIEEYNSDLSDYRFVSFRGKLEPVMDSSERTEAINKFATEGKQKLSKNFLLAHGFERSDWSAFRPDRPLVIMKLDEVVETVGLKSS